MDNLSLNNNMGWAMSSMAISDTVERRLNDEQRVKITEASKEEALNRYRDGDRSDEVLRILDRTEL
ncbi:MAG: hypothetical protein NC223_07910 [Butyrivibrio sp.]|nr:hypothetical protein [Butyrivibrio sp.]